LTATGDRISLDELCIDTIRTLSMDAVQKANAGHPGAPMGLAPVAYTLYTRLMRHNPADAEWIDRDRFVLSAGHASMLLYASLYLSGYPITLDDLEHFRQLGSPTAGHPERWDVPGIEATTGPLGQGLSTSVGLALAERMLSARFNVDGRHNIVDHFTWVIASDGDIQEGVASEASSLAGHLGLGKLIVFYDDNKIQLASPTELVFSEDVAARYEAYDWHVINLGEDLSIERLEEAAHHAMDVDDRPSLIICRTHIGFGSPNKQDSTKAHGSPLGEDEVRLTKEVYGWDPDKHFYVPDDALAHWRSAVAERAKSEDEWNRRFEAYSAEQPELASELKRIVSLGGPPTDWATDVPKFDLADKAIATRAASGQALQWAAAKVPELIGGSADLASSNDTDIKGSSDVVEGDYSGRNLHFGVREHGMGAIVNGLGLHGFRAYGGTFLTFSDYMRGAVRLSALMHLPSIWVWTHDSIGLGEDGPTHQPIEHLAALRAMPNLSVIRPADGNETALAWRHAINSMDHPCALIFTRQAVPRLDPAAVPDDAVDRGAYVLRDTEGEPDVILIGTGSEVGVALDAADLLKQSNIAARVVSMPCMDHFSEQPDDYRNSVLPPKVRARVAVEAAATLGWHRWVGDLGEVIGMHSFGASGKAEDLFPYFGITAEKTAEAAQTSLSRARSI
jgi:transketolase